MGVCCTRRAQDALSEEILEYEQQSHTSHRVEPELMQESERSSIVISISALMTELKGVIPFSVRLFTFVNLYNVTIRFQENQTNSPYVIYDLRPADKKIENFLKKMRHINYSYDEMKVMTNDKLKNLRRFLNSKSIIFILPDEATDLLQNIFTFITEINLDVSVYVLNINLSPLLLSPYSHRLYHSLDDRLYSTYPYVLMPYKHLKHFSNDGFVFFLNRLDSQFSKERLTKAESDKDPLFAFWKGFKISTIIRGTANEENVRTNNQDELIEFAIGEERYRQAMFSFKETKKNVDTIQNICFWLKKQVMKGNSFIIEVDSSALIEQYLPFVIAILWKVTMIQPHKLMDYLSESVCFLDDFKRILELNRERTIKLLNLFGLEESN